MAESETRQLVVYIVFGVNRINVNDRINKLLQLRHLFAKMVLVTPGKKAQRDTDQLVVKPINNPTGLFRRLGLQRLRKAVDRYLFFPSPHVLFLQPAQRQVARLIAQDLENGQQVCLMTCAPPHGIGLLGLYIKRKFPQVHWLIDWQDLWSYDENYYNRTPRLFRNRLKKIEQRMLQTADMNITTNAYAEAVLQNHYAVPVARTTHIHHHFDREDVNDAIQEAPAEDAETGTDTIKIGFLGTLFKPPRVPGGALVDTLAQLRVAGLNLELHVHGLLPPDYAEIKPRLDQAGVVMHGPSSHEQAVRQLQKYDYLLLLLADLRNCEVVMSIKLPHYLMMRKTILAIVPEHSAIADIIRDCGAGFVIPTVSDWNRELMAILSNQNRSANIPARNEAIINQFEWKNISSQWLQVFERALRP